MQPSLDRSLGHFLDDLADSSPVPGAGSAAAIATAMAAGLVVMVARASTDSWPDARAVAAQAESLRARAAPLAERAAAAYSAALDALTGPAEADGALRDERLGEALSRAAAVPLDIAEVASDAAELGALAAECGDPQRRADAAAAVVLADAAARICADLVRVNLATRAEDQRVARADELTAATARAALRALGES